MAQASRCQRFHSLRNLWRGAGLMPSVSRGAVWLLQRFGMSRSASEAMLPKRRTAQIQDLQHRCARSQTGQVSLPRLGIRFWRRRGLEAVGAVHCVQCINSAIALSSCPEQFTGDRGLLSLAWRIPRTAWMPRFTILFGRCGPLEGMA